MTREDILTKVIAIAKRNGFDISDDFFTEIPAENWLQEGQDLFFSLIYCHDFAIAFFGDNLISINEENGEPFKEVDLLSYDNPMAFLMSNRENIKLPIWQFHLIQLMLCEDPLEYLFKFTQEQ